MRQKAVCSSKCSKLREQLRDLKTRRTSTRKELSVTSEVRAERSVDKDDGRATRRNELASIPTNVCREADVTVAYYQLVNSAEQPSMEEEMRSCVSNAQRVEPGLLHDQVDQVLTG